MCRGVGDVRSRRFVWALYAVLAVVAWQTGVFWWALFGAACFVAGVAATWAYARLKIGDG